MPNGREKEDARRVIASAQQEAQRIARLESGLRVAAGKIESYRRVMLLMIRNAPGQCIRIPEAEIDAINALDGEESKSAVFEVDADSEPGFISYRIPSAETLAAAGRVRSMAEHVETAATAVPPVAVQDDEAAKLEGEFPLADPIPERPGWVRSPHAPNESPVDCNGFAAGMKVRCPHTNKIFIVPFMPAA